MSRDANQPGVRNTLVKQGRAVKVRHEMQLEIFCLNKAVWRNSLDKSNSWSEPDVHPEYQPPPQKKKKKVKEKTCRCWRTSCSQQAWIKLSQEAQASTPRLGETLARRRGLLCHLSDRGKKRCALCWMGVRGQLPKDSKSGDTSTSDEVHAQAQVTMRVSFACCIRRLNSRAQRF